MFAFEFLTTFLVNSPADAFAATLAYTAVLMAFVGVTIQDSRK